VTAPGTSGAEPGPDGSPGAVSAPAAAAREDAGSARTVPDDLSGHPDRSDPVPAGDDEPVDASPEPAQAAAAQETVTVRCDVVLPCRDEALALPAVLAALP
jgi:hypothetical protein